MNVATPARRRLTRSLMAGAAAIAIVTAPYAARDASARVGVTSATDGDPLGKPPSEASRAA